jgi:thiamine-phosphate diphosphorylase/hydroxyethylthiazole kinase
MIQVALGLKRLCDEYGIPLIINDRVDVALAVDCAGVHLGQDDMDIAMARRWLGRDKIIGATVSSTREALVAIEKGADYLGIGTLYPTATKDSKNIIGINGARAILNSLDARTSTRETPTVCIGGISDANIQRIKFQLSMPKSGVGSDESGPPTSDFAQSIDGVAVVSAIMAKDDPKSAAANLLNLWLQDAPFAPRAPNFCDKELLPGVWNEALVQVATKSPLSHNMTNTVVQNFAADVALAIGASPIMSSNGNEAGELAVHQGGLLINMGTATSDMIQQHIKAIQAYNAIGGPIVLDPVGAGANTVRTQQLKHIMANGYFHVIKGNEKEIIAVAKASGYTVKVGGPQRGVDSGESTLSAAQKAYMVSAIAERERNVVLMTGEQDFISDGSRVHIISNGHELLKEITGSGCVLGTIISAYLAANKEEDRLEVAVAAILHLEIAAERAQAREDVHGPGTFKPALIDELWKIRGEGQASSGYRWLTGARVQMEKVKVNFDKVDFMELGV